MSSFKVVKTFLKRKFPSLVAGIQSALPSTRARKRELARKSAHEVFSEIYRNNKWQDPESVSGNGSTLAYTRQIRALLPPLLAKLQVRVLLDAPCGDFNWMRHVDLAIEQYIGGDIVPELVARLQTEFASESRRFMVLNLIEDTLPTVDALFCRDCLLHLSFKDISAVLKNFKKSQCQFLITSNYPTVQTNTDILTGEDRVINLCLPPFNFPAPLQVIDDSGDDSHGRVMGVWRRDQL